MNEYGDGDRKWRVVVAISSRGRDKPSYYINMFSVPWLAKPRGILSSFQFMYIIA